MDSQSMRQGCPRGWGRLAKPGISSADPISQAVSLRQPLRRLFRGQKGRVKPTRASEFWHHTSNFVHKSDHWPQAFTSSHALHYWGDTSAFTCSFWRQMRLYHAWGLSRGISGKIFKNLLSLKNCLKSLRNCLKSLKNCLKSLKNGLKSHKNGLKWL